MALPKYGQNIEVSTSTAVVGSTQPQYGQSIFRPASKTNLPIFGIRINKRIG